MGLLTSVLPWYVRMIFVAVVLAAAGAMGAAGMHKVDESTIADLRLANANFVAGVEAQHSAAALRAAQQHAADIAAQEKANEDAHSRIADLDAIVARLRNAAAARDSRGGSMSAAPPNSKCPPGDTCFDTAEYQRAIGEFDSGARRLADEGSKVEVDLDVARHWATAPPN